MSSTAKNWVIVILCLVIAGQAWLLRDRFTAAFQEKPSIQAVTLDSPMRTTISVEFNQPVAESVRTHPQPAGIEPEAAGQWVWSNPYSLKFLSQEPLPLNMEYVIRLNAAFGRCLKRCNRPCQTGNFAVQEFVMNELPSDAGPTMVEFKGKISFNAAVDGKICWPPCLRLRRTARSSTFFTNIVAHP